MNFPIYTYVIIYAITIITGLFRYSKYAHKIELKLFLFFLIFSLIIEFAGAYVGRVLLLNTNYIYNTWNIVNSLFFAFFVLSRIKQKRKRIYIKSLVGVFICLTVINISFYANFINQILIYNIVFSKLLVVIYIIIYFTELLNSDEILKIKNSLFLWICLGAFLYNLAFVPALALAKFTSYYGMFKYITFGLNIIMHLFFITGFIVCRKEFNN